MTDKAIVQEVKKNLFLVQLPVPIPGFEGFVTSWVHTADPVAVIDTGPASTVPALLEALKVIGVDRMDYILLTHIHIDHAGGVGGVAKAFPETPVVCHPKAVPHLIDPERLWQGSLQTLGDTARAYGPIAPVAAGQVLASDQFKIPLVDCVNTPGHAAHHISFAVGDLLFAGEAGGVCLPMDSSSLYLRPATPPRFFMETHLESLDQMLALTPRYICYGHVGMRDDAAQLLQSHREQLLRWKEWILPFHRGATDSESTSAMLACREYLISEDPLLAGFAELSPAVQARENKFILNSIRGFWGDL